MGWPLDKASARRRDRKVIRKNMGCKVDKVTGSVGEVGYAFDMPRSARLDVIGVVQHVMARSIDGRALFRDDRDREEFMRRLGEVVGWGSAQLLAWSLMSNHLPPYSGPGRPF